MSRKEIFHSLSFPNKCAPSELFLCFQMLMTHLVCVVSNLVASINFFKFTLSLKQTGHRRSEFGRGQIITVGEWWNPSVSQDDSPSRVLWGGSDPRGDGCAQGY